MTKIEKLEGELEKLQGLDKKLSLVYRTTRNEAQKTRVSVDLKNIKKSAMNIEEEISVLRVSGEGAEIVEDDSSSSGGDDFPDHVILPDIRIEPVSEHCKDEEINAAGTYLLHFSNEYWPAFSDYHLKLDYNMNQKRFGFYPIMENCKKMLESYTDLVEDISARDVSETYQKAIADQMRKNRRLFLVESSRFFRKIADFVDDLIEAHENNPTIILNVTEKMRFDKFEGKKKLEGRVVMSAIKELSAFAKEFVSYFKVPNF